MFRSFFGTVDHRSTEGIIASGIVAQEPSSRTWWRLLYHSALYNPRRQSSCDKNGHQRRDLRAQQTHGPKTRLSPTKHSRIKDHYPPILTQSFKSQIFSQRTFLNPCSYSSETSSSDKPKFQPIWRTKAFIPTWNKAKGGVLRFSIRAFISRSNSFSLANLCQDEVAPPAPNI